MKQFKKLDEKTLVNTVGGGSREKDFNAGRNFVRIIRYILGGR
ncbi:hypothetical protein [Streptococcus suis]|nr:hypothetical protein [Streptococcus suis]